MQRCFILTALFALLLCTAGQTQERQRPKNFTGELTKVDKTSLTLTQRGDGGTRELALKIDANTKILLETNDDEEVKGDGGTVRTRPKTKEGKIADLQVKQRIMVQYLEENRTARTVTVLRPGKGRGDGGR